MLQEFQIRMLEVHKQMLQHWQLSAMKSYRDALKKRCLAEGFSPLTGDGIE
ncbi:hypothetical protein [Phocaeicola vulgatus]|jgi:hypothetical protein|uniref:hypothetical protein n=1 Tax=Phocaeicola vulgatus TaxID=821 RepID=UPI002165ACF1|nr:hypothetical protein [Phocaeicola vulgatus]MCS2996805.1 hypothetical protein [Phocaeicola vulgatus]MCS3133732.1 hypothetical protein [Phocaeicola vulgatus]